MIGPLETLSLILDLGMAFLEMKPVKLQVMDSLNVLDPLAKRQLTHVAMILTVLDAATVGTGVL